MTLAVYLSATDFLPYYMYYIIHTLTVRTYVQIALIILLQPTLLGLNVQAVAYK